MEVTRVQDGDMSCVEPPLDQNWSDRKKLEWHAAVAAYDTGVRFEIRDGSFKVRDRTGLWGEKEPHYSVIVGGSSSVHSFDSAWTYINGACAGARAARS